MTPRETIDSLVRMIREHLPGVVVSVDEPAHEWGHWFVDVREGERWSAVEFRPKVGQFGLCTCDCESHGFGEGPDEIQPTTELAAERFAEILRTRTRTARESERPLPR
jgi:hypothetical protein